MIHPEELAACKRRMIEEREDEPPKDEQDPLGRFGRGDE